MQIVARCKFLINLLDYRDIIIIDYFKPNLYLLDSLIIIGQITWQSSSSRKFQDKLINLKTKFNTFIAECNIQKFRK